MMHRKFNEMKRLMRPLILALAVLLGYASTTSVEGFLLPPRTLQPPLPKHRRPCALLQSTHPSYRFPASGLAEKKQNMENGDLISHQDFEDPKAKANQASRDQQAIKTTNVDPNSLHRALHQAKHRTTEKFYSVAAGRLTESFHNIAQKGSIRRRIYSKLKQMWQQGATRERIFPRIRRLFSNISTRIRRRKGAMKVFTKSVAAGRASIHVMEESVGHAAKASASKQGSKIIQRAAAKQSRKASRRTGKLVVKYAESSGEHAAVRVARSTSKRLSVRFAKGLTIALPVIGGIFAVILLRQDWQRLREEQNLRERSLAPLAFFAGATAADFVDVLLHFFLAYGLLAHLKRHWLAVAEEWSIGCAAISTACAVIGEITSFRTHYKKEGMGA